MSPKTLTIIFLRILAIYVFIQSLSSIGFLVAQLIDPEFASHQGLKYQLLSIALYYITIFVLARYSSQIAERIVKVLPADPIHSTIGSGQSLAILIAVVGIFGVISSLPLLVNQLYGVSQIVSNVSSQDFTLKTQVNRMIVSLVGAIIKFAVSIIVVFKAKPLANYWEHLYQHAA
jgi:hypothetical protein